MTCSQHIPIKDIFTRLVSMSLREANMSEFTELFQLDNLINEVETRYLSKLIILMSDINLEEKKCYLKVSLFSTLKIDEFLDKN